jgi:pyruvate/2-oxoglutarate dehydrogenase complex dihydrolipoamide dehydrogenase (E3) component
MPETAVTASRAEEGVGGVAIHPPDAHNRRLVSLVHPPEWRNPIPRGRYNLVVVGAGTAGLVSAAGAAGLGARVALVERHLLGGDCLNVGCVPSKGLIAAARVAAQARRAADFGVRVSEVSVDFGAVMERMRRLRSGIAPVDSVGRFTELGVDVFMGHGRFTGPTSLEVGGQNLEFARAVIATGARAAAPPIAGLAEAGYLTNETLFSLTELPRRLLVIGGGPIGCEMAQAFCRFGSEVTLLEASSHVLVREDADAAAIVEQQLQRDGVRALCEATVTGVETRGAEQTVHYRLGDTAHAVTCDAILVAVGRAPNLDDLGLEAAGVRFGRSGVEVNDRLQTSNARIYAAGDIASRYKFTHTADALARIVLQNALFGGRKKASALTVPWCTYTSPEVAHVGLSEREAAERGLAVTTFTTELQHVDRAILDGDTAGFVRVHVKAGTDRIVGATIVAEHAGEMISEISAAMAGRLGLGRLASIIHPYPTQAEAIRKTGDAYNRTRLTPLVRTLFAGWLALRRR